MAKSFSAFTLVGEQIAVVFPLVHAAAPEIDLDRWRNFAHSFVDGGTPSSCGAIGLRNAAGYVCGLLIFRAERDLRHGMVLAIDLFAALDLVNDEEATRALMQAAEIKARELGCAAVQIRLGTTQKTLADRLAAAAHRREASIFCKRVESLALPS